MPNTTPLFAGDGIVITPIGSFDDLGFSAVVQSDGKIVVVGSSFNGSNDDFALVRYNADGSLDTSFGGGDGIVTTTIGSNHDVATGVVLQADGKIVVAGTSTSGSNGDFALVRYNADGSLDTSFGGGDGIVTTPIGSGDDIGTGFVLQADGKFVVAGISFNGTNNDFALARYKADGTLDTSFGGGDGIVTTPLGDDTQAQSVAVQADGKIVVAGLRFSGTLKSDFALVRYNADGSLDSGFGGGDGVVTTPVGATFDVGADVVVQTNGKILVAGRASTGSLDDFALVRYNADGSLDTSFGGGDGIVTTPIGPGNDFGTSVVVQPDGKIIVGGWSATAGLALVRYNANGSLDTSFGGGDGIATTSAGLVADLGLKVVLQADGKIVLVGGSKNGSDYDFSLVRFNADGSLDVGGSHAPTSIALSKTSVAEFRAKGTAVGTLSTSDPDGGSHTYTLLNNAGGRFAISGDKLVVADGLKLDFEQHKSHSVTVRSTDQDGHSVQKTLTVGITNVAPEKITGNSSANTFVAGKGNDQLKGAGGNDTLVGGAGKDTLNGGAGKDEITGGAGKDKMTGGAGDDDFNFKLVSETGKSSSTRDIITDFKHGHDDIDLSAIDANGKASGNGKFSFHAHEGDSFTGHKGEVRWFHQGSKTIVEGDIDGNKHADFQIELTGKLTLTKADFFL